MDTNVVEINNSEYYKIELIEVNQNNKIFYIGKINVKYLHDKFTVNPASYILDTLPEDEDFLEDNQLISKLKEKATYNIEGYQRDITSSKKLEDIAAYIRNSNEKSSDFHIIPNSIILATKTERIRTEKDTISSDKKLNLFDEEKKILYIPKNTKSSLFFVIDGHHRLRGISIYLKENRKKNTEELPLNTELIEDFEIPITLLIDKDPVVEAEIFQTVNSTVKPVNKSYIYHVAGGFEIGEQENIMLHYIARFFNQHKTSPFYDRIKMLGRSIDNKTDIKQTISQSFFIDQINSWTMVNKKINYDKLVTVFAPKRIPVLRYFFINDKVDEIAKILFWYFDAIKIALNYRIADSWDNEKDNIFIRTLGFGALISIFPLLYVDVISRNALLSKQDSLEKDLVKRDFVDIFKKIFSSSDDILNINNKYKNSSSQGLVRDLSKDLLEKNFNINLSELEKNYKDAKTNNNDYKQYVFDINGLKEYSQWYSREVCKN